MRVEANPFQTPETELGSDSTRPLGTVEGALPYFSVGSEKLVIMGLASFSFYNLYWFYRQFASAEARGDVRGYPFWRAVFALFFCHELFKGVWMSAEAEEVKPYFKPGAATAGFILLSLCGYLPNPFWLLGFGALIPLVSVQRTINAIHAKIAPTAEKNSRLSGANWVVIVLGGSFWLLVLMGLLMGA